MNLPGQNSLPAVSTPPKENFNIMQNNLKSLQTDLKKLADPQKAIVLQRFFKTGKGQYGEGDLFLGIVVPKQRILAKKYFNDITLSDTEKLLHGKFHEERLIALIILVLKFKKFEDLQEKIYRLYLKNTKYINNWDLVDLTAPHIIGGYLFEKDKSVLIKLAKSKSLWEKRIAILATLYFTYYGRPEWAIKISEKLVKDKHDLIHKAVGWMLREVGKRCSQEIEEKFLQKHCKTMPRTMLRYAIERFPETTRKRYLQTSSIRIRHYHQKFPKVK